MYELHTLPGASYTIATATSDDRRRPFSLLAVHEADTPQSADDFAVCEDINPIHSHRALTYTSCCSILHLLDSLEDVHDKWLFDATTTIDSRFNTARANPTSERPVEPIPPSSDDLQATLARLSEVTVPDHHISTTGDVATCLLHQDTHTPHSLAHLLSEKVVNELLSLPNRMSMDQLQTFLNGIDSSRQFADHVAALTSTLRASLRRHRTSLRRNGLKPSDPPSPADTSMPWTRHRLECVQSIKYLLRVGLNRIDPCRNPACIDDTPLSQLEEPSADTTGKSVLVQLGLAPGSSIYAPMYAMNDGQTSLRVDLTFFDPHPPDTTVTPRPVQIRAVVDSGAMWTAMRADYFNSIYPRPLLHPAPLKFRGASNEPIQVLGYCNLAFRLSPKSPVIHTVVFVFPSLAEPMLLGTNTMARHGMVINLANMSLSTSSPTPMPVDAQPLITDVRTVDPPPPLPEAQQIRFMFSESTQAMYCLAADRCLGYAKAVRSPQPRSGRGDKRQRSEPSHDGTSSDSDPTPRVATLPPAAGPSHDLLRAITHRYCLPQSMTTRITDALRHDGPLVADQHIYFPLRLENPSEITRLQPTQTFDLTPDERRAGVQPGISLPTPRFIPVHQFQPHLAAGLIDQWLRALPPSQPYRQVNRDDATPRRYELAGSPQDGIDLRALPPNCSADDAYEASLLAYYFDEAQDTWMIYADPPSSNSAFTSSTPLRYPILTANPVDSPGRGDLFFLMWRIFKGIRRHN